MPNPGYGQSTPRGVLDPFQSALLDFRQARKRASMEAILGRFTGKSTELLSYNDVAEKLHLRERVDRGEQEIPVEAIVGSIGRYTDFSRSFLPRHDWDAERWAGVRAAEKDPRSLPPISVYKVGEAYFVEDGNHRVSISRQQGIGTIAAHVTEVCSKVTVPADVQPDELILKSEQVVFLERTKLDQLRSGSDLNVSIPGQYEKLESHIEIHRHFIEVAEGVTLSDEEAVTHWYDEAYLPVVAAIREYGILQDYPGRTECDLYLWVAQNQAAIREELGWEVTPETIVTQAATQYDPQERHRLGQAYHKVLDTVSPKRWIKQTKHQSWSQHKLLDRYGDHLFSEILVLLNPDGSWGALDHALLVAGREDARVEGLLALTDPAGRDNPELQNSEDEFNNRCQEAGVEGALAIEIGKPMDLIEKRAELSDLVLLDRHFLPPVEEEGALVKRLQAVARRCARPLLVVSERPCSLAEVVLAYDRRPQAREALYVATYLAECWGSPLTVVTSLIEDDDNLETVDRAHQYLDLHEVEASFLPIQEGADETVSERFDQSRDFLVVGGYRSGWLHRSGGVNPANQWIGRWAGPVLICS